MVCKNVFAMNILVPFIYIAHLHCPLLNLAIIFSRQVKEVRNSMGIIQCVSTFFGYPKKTNYFSIEEAFSQTYRFIIKKSMFNSIGRSP